MLLSGSLEGMHGAEALAIFEVLEQTQHDHCDGCQYEHVGMRKVRQRAEQGDEHAGGSDYREAERVNFAALNECGELVAIESLGHGNGSLLELRKIDGSYILLPEGKTC